MMKRTDEKGLTLIELIIAIGILGLISAAAAPLLSSALQAHSFGESRSGLYQEGLLAMERMTGGVRRCTYLLVPNAHNTTRDILAFSGNYNDDDDYYFDDSLFPRIDEDMGADMDGNNAPGIALIDDDGNSLIDDGGTGDDDEDGLNDEDQLDGLDNDGDGNIDEDFSVDVRDGEPGIKNFDDDGDGSVDEGNFKDDDEDGSFEEDPLNAVVYELVSGTSTLTESIPHSGASVYLSTRVSNFQVVSGTSNCVLITLTLTDNDGKTVTFSEYVHPRNTYQKTGRRVR